eukprot:2552423-Amphidinium_carterae.1
MKVLTRGEGTEPTHPCKPLQLYLPMVSAASLVRPKQNHLEKEHEQEEHMRHSIFEDPLVRPSDLSIAGLCLANLHIHTYHSKLCKLSECQEDKGHHQHTPQSMEELQLLRLLLCLKYATGGPWVTSRACLVCSNEDTVKLSIASPKELNTQ